VKSRPVGEGFARFSGAAVMKGLEFYRAVAEASGERDPAVVRRMTAAVLHALRDRLTRDESDQVFAQLPWELRVVWVRASHETAARCA
jgi:uncharacterized protein (DUF2267 family)